MRKIVHEIGYLRDYHSINIADFEIDLHWWIHFLSISDHSKVFMTQKLNNRNKETWSRSMPGYVTEQKDYSVVVYIHVIKKVSPRGACWFVPGKEGIFVPINEGKMPYPEFVLNHGHEISLNLSCSPYFVMFYPPEILSSDKVIKYLIEILSGLSILLIIFASVSEIFQTLFKIFDAVTNHN